MTRASSKAPPLPEAVAERQEFAHTMAQAPWLGARAAVSMAGSGRQRVALHGSVGMVPEAGAWTGFWSNDLLAKRLGSAITAHGGFGTGIRSNPGVLNQVRPKPVQSIRWDFAPDPKK